jgi:cobalamin biosynthesis protein CobD/CbiB
MTKYLKKYTRGIEEILKGNDKKTNWEKVLENHRIQIGFFQHERLIHLLVTLTFGIVFCIFMVAILVYQIQVLMVANFLVTIMLLGYLFHYFGLENGVQKLYKLDKEIQEKL